MTEVNCYRRDLTSIPELPVTAVTEDLSFNDIDKLPPRAFSKLSKLGRLNLYSNKIQTVKQSSFEGLDSLTHLGLSLNKLSTVTPRTFTHLPKLERLDLYSNQIQTIDQSSFEGLDSLTHLGLSGNKLSTVTPRTFTRLPKLERLDLYSNQIQTIDQSSFEGLDSLTHLGLSGNKLSTVTPRTFTHLPKLERLDLYSNQIQTIDQSSFEGLDSLTHLGLSGNKLSTVTPRTFTHLPKLERLDLYSNQIQTIDQSSFEGLDSLTHLGLSGNKLSTVTPRTFTHLPKLERLDLYSNQIQTIDQSSFEGLDSLTHLGLSGNKLSTVTPRTFTHLPKLEWLNLYRNQIQTIDEFAFDGLQNLTELDLSWNKIQILESKSIANIPILNELYLTRNKIEKISDDAFIGTERISWIDLSVNSLSEVPSIGTQHRLNRLKLSNNQIVNATFPSSYRSCDGNLSIDLSYNKIETLDKFTFSSLAGATIVELKLNYNSITVVGPGTFDPPASMEMLYIGSNPLGSESLINIVVGCYRNNITLGFLDDVELENDLSAIMKLGIPLGLCATVSSKQVFQEFQNLTIITLTKKDLITLSRRYFPGKKNVLALDLAGMDISSFPEYLPTSLESLDLRRNKIAELASNEISDLRGLKVLLLAGNDIGYISPDAFNGLGVLKVLNLAKNSIKDLSETTLNTLNNLTHLYLGGNEIKLLREVPNPLVSLRVLDLSDNDLEYVDAPLSESFPFLHMLNLEGNNLVKILFQSDIGDRLFSNLRELLDINIARNNIPDLPDLVFRDQGSLKRLNMRMNKISSLGPNVFRFTNNIENIDISSNSLSILTESNLCNLNNLKEVNLTDNKFMCNCDLLWFRDWIDHTTVVLPDKESYMCDGPGGWKGKPLLEFTKDKITCTVIPAVLGAVSGAVFFTVVSGFLIYRNRWRLRLCLYLLSKRVRRFIKGGRRHAQYPNNGAINDDGRRDHYDAYISCNESDYDWVLHHLLPGIDNGDYADDGFGGDFHLYYDPRDQDPGNDWLTFVLITSFDLSLSQIITRQRPGPTKSFKARLLSLTSRHEISLHFYISRCNILYIQFPIEI